MALSLDEFIQKYNGKGIDFDGAYGFQCFDLYRQYCKEVLSVPQSPPTGDNGAVTIWTTYLKEYFDAIPNTPTGVPQKGDIVIWDKRIGPFGHVAVFIEGDTNNFKSFDQNSPVGTPCHVQAHSYFGVIGWIHPKGASVVLPTPPQEVITNPQQKIDLGSYGVMELQAIISSIKAKDQDLETKRKAITKLEDELKACKETPPNAPETPIYENPSIPTSPEENSFSRFISWVVGLVGLKPKDDVEKGN